MKTKVLTALKEADDYISGQELCERFGVSRTAIWKAVNQLKEAGYEIEAIQNKGYKILSVPDRLSESELQSIRKTSWAGKEIFYYDVIDSTNTRAKQLAEEEQADCEFAVMDAENPEFPDGTFDVIISRNLTWTLPHVKHAYGEWLRVLKKGGVLLNFDANYGITDFSNVEDLPENHAHNMLGNEMMRECEEIKRQLPISSYSRPAWDLETLGAMSLKEFHMDLGISSRIYLEKDECYNPTPLFMLRTVK